jgi:hypothetical protein
MWENDIWKDPEYNTITKFVWPESIWVKLCHPAAASEKLTKSPSLICHAKLDAEILSQWIRVTWGKAFLQRFPLQHHQGKATLAQEWPRFRFVRPPRIFLSTPFFMKVTLAASVINGRPFGRWQGIPADLDASDVSWDTPMESFEKVLFRSF